jgi:hypothetical protein
MIAMPYNDESSSDSEHSDDDDVVMETAKSRNALASLASSHSSNGNTKKRRRSQQQQQQASPGLVAMFSPRDAVPVKSATWKNGSDDCDDSDSSDASSVSFGAKLAHAKRHRSDASGTDDRKPAALQTPNDDDESSINVRVPTKRQDKRSSNTGNHKSGKEAVAARTKKLKAAHPKQLALRDDSSDNDSISISFDEQSEQEPSDDDNNVDNGASYETQFLNDATGKKPVHASTLQFTIHVLQQQATQAITEIASDLRAQGAKQEAKQVQIRSDLHQKKIVQTVRQLLRSTKVPSTYAKVEDPCVEHMHTVNQERRQDMERADQLLDKLSQQRERLEQELEEETNRFNELQKRVAQDVKARDETHFLLSQLESDDPRNANAKKQGVDPPRKLRSAPKGTMSTLLLKLTK